MAPKRKRANTVQKEPEQPQPSSRDASGEDNTADPVLDAIKTQKENLSADPPAKRRSTRGKTNGSSKEEEEDVDEGSVEGSEKSEEEEDGGGENGEAASMRMEAPPKAGMIDPVGYHTNPPPKGRPVRVYADGVFDLFHLGHMRQLQQAKTAFPDTYLLVGVTGDRETHRRKGLTVLSAKERAETVRHCKWVDEVVEDCPWIVTVDFLEKHQIDYVAHDDIPYGADEGDDIYKPVKEKGMFLVTQRTEGVSTTGIITKIVRDYESYIARQLKRGTSRQELNISWLKKNELDIKRHVTELRESIRANWTTTGQELGKELRQLWQPSRQSSPAPSIASRRGLRSERSEDETPTKGRDGAKSPTTLSLKDRMPHLEIPGPSGLQTPRTEKRESDFAAGYAMGLIGGVKSWMQRNRRNVLSDSRPPSPGSDDDSDAKSPQELHQRGRLGKSEQDEVDAQVSDEMDLRKD